MSHFKQFSEHRHGRSVAKKRAAGYADGGEVKRLPISGTQYDLQRLRSAQGVESGRIAGIPGRPSNTVYGPGLNSRGEVRSSVLRRMKTDELPMQTGGRVKMMGGAESGAGRMELAKIQASRRKK